MPTDTTPDRSWSDLLARWDAQQGVYIAGRERGYDLMLAFLDELVPPDGRRRVVVDLLSGPGSISARLLERRPDAVAVAVDADPVLLAIGQGAHGDGDGRLRWVRADVRDPGWVDALGEQQVDAILSSTATHWLEPAALAALYRSLAGLLRPGGVFLNFDGFAPTGATPRLDAAVDVLDRGRQEQAVAAGAQAWQDWWDTARDVPTLRERFAERDRVFPPTEGRIFGASRRRRGTSVAFGEAALLEAGFAEVGVVWQDLHKRILVALAAESEDGR